MDKVGIVSTQRVKQFGEVYTPDSIVNDMLDLTDKQIKTSDKDYISVTYLEPACGDGQFLIRILSRKLEEVVKLPTEQRELALVKALSSIYGVDIQPDNPVKCRNRMMDIILGKSVETFDIKDTHYIQIDLDINITDELKSTLEWILEHNIVVGNTLEPGKWELLFDKPSDGSLMLPEYLFNTDGSVTISLVPFSDISENESAQHKLHTTTVKSINDIRHIIFTNENGEANNNNTDDEEFNF